MYVYFKDDTNTWKVPCSNLLMETFQEASLALLMMTLKRNPKVLRYMCIGSAFGFFFFLNFTSVLSLVVSEFLNLQLFDLAKSYHSALSKVDVSADFHGKWCGFCCMERKLSSVSSLLI